MGMSKGEQSLRKRCHKLPTNIITDALLSDNILTGFYLLSTFTVLSVGFHHFIAIHGGVSKSDTLYSLFLFQPPGGFIRRVNCRPWVTKTVTRCKGGTKLLFCESCPRAETLFVLRARFIQRGCE